MIIEKVAKVALVTIRDSQFISQRVEDCPGTLNEYLDCNGKNIPGKNV